MIAASKCQAVLIALWCGVYYLLGVWPPDIGSRNRVELATADRKQWRCSAKVIEPEKKLVIALSDRSPPIEYLWAQKSLVNLPGWKRLRP